MKKNNTPREVLEVLVAVGGPLIPINDFCRQLGIAEQTLYVWKKKYAYLGVSELRRLRQLEE